MISSTATIEPEVALAPETAIENKEVNVKIIVTDKTDEEQVASHEKVDSNQQSTVGHLLFLFCLNGQLPKRRKVFIPLGILPHVR